MRGTREQMEKKVVIRLFCKRDYWDENTKQESRNCQLWSIQLRCFTGVISIELLSPRYQESGLYNRPYLGREIPTCAQGAEVFFWHNDSVMQITIENRFFLYNITMECCHDKAISSVPRAWGSKITPAMQATRTIAKSVAIKSDSSAFYRRW